MRKRICNQRLNVIVLKYNYILKTKNPVEMIVLNTSLSMSCSKILKYNEWQTTEQINF